MQQKLCKFVQQGLHCVKQCGQGILGNVPHRAHVHRGVAMDQLVAKRHDLRQVWMRAAMAASSLANWLRASPMTSNLRSTAAFAIALPAYAVASMSAMND